MKLEQAGLAEMISSFRLEKTPTHRPGGRPLVERIREGDTCGLAGQIAIALQLARILDSWHGKGIFHGNLDCQCVLVDDAGVVGLAETGCRDRSARQQDIRQFGHILYQLLLGGLMGRESPPDLEPLHKAGISPRLVGLLSECTSDEELPRNFRSIAGELEAILREMVEGPSPGVPWKMISIVVLLLAAVAGIAFYLR
ncbi:MAG: hypothetical protein HY235_04515 [Acidobacteria bacterium]|nr:hypothetical protein [Acidobacteriota bacterium]